jgi:glucosyl-dolichyl phosphate glucuronosyltransferase
MDDIFKQKKDESFSFDVIVVDNNSTDNTKDVVLSFEKKFPGQIQYILERKQGKCNALNTGILACQADFIAFTDDDVRVDQQWLLNIVKCFESQKCDGVGGRILPVFPPQTPAWIKENISLLAGCIVVYDYGTETKLYQKPTYEFLGANYAFKRQVFDDCGLFRTDIGPGKGTYGDDTEFVGRTLRFGKKLYYCGEALVWHPVDINRTNLIYIAQWYMGLGRYRIIVDEQATVDPSLVYWFGIPRYLIGQILKNTMNASIHIFNKKDFLKAWTQLFVNVGRAKQIRKIYLTKGIHQ